MHKLGNGLRCNEAHGQFSAKIIHKLLLRILYDRIYGTDKEIIPLLMGNDTSRVALTSWLTTSVSPVLRNASKEQRFSSAIGYHSQRTDYSYAHSLADSCRFLILFYWVLPYVIYLPGPASFGYEFGLYVLTASAAMNMFFLRRSRAVFFVSRGSRKLH